MLVKEIDILLIQTFHFRSSQRRNFEFEKHFFKERRNPYLDNKKCFGSNFVLIRARS